MSRRLARLALLGAAALVLARAASAQECLDCHAQPGAEVSFADGSKKDATIHAQAWETSVHGAAGIGCADCHAGREEYPHPKPDAASARAYAIAGQAICEGCHEEQSKRQKDSVHWRLIGAGRADAAVCSDCHDPHAQRKLTGEDGRLLPEARLAVPATCARCHAAIQQQYRASVHGRALVDGSADVPTCIDCHGVHDIRDPRTAAFRLASPRLCADCHTDARRMARYGLSTEVLRTYVADFHGSTVTLFERRHPDQATGKPVCYDCHGIHDIASQRDPQKSLRVKANLLATCRKCHPDATAGFPDAWLSHYVPAPDRAPLVYWSRLAYQVLIPTVVGGMALFVASDVVRRRLDRRAARRAAKEAAPPA